MPTEEEWIELKKNCTFTEIEVGLIVTAKNGNCIILQKTGDRTGSTLRGGRYCYWSSTLESYGKEFAYCFYYKVGNLNLDIGIICERYRGLAVRPVIDK